MIGFKKISAEASDNLTSAEDLYRQLFPVLLVLVVLVLVILIVLIILVVLVVLISLVVHLYHPFQYVL